MTLANALICPPSGALGLKCVQKDLAGNQNKLDKKRLVECMVTGLGML